MRPIKPLLVAAVTTAAISGLGAGQAQAHAQIVTPQTTYCKVVTAVDLNFYDSASATGADGSFKQGQRFLTDRTDPPYNRYHVVLSPYSPEGWVSSDPAWTNPC